jgi:hypothetical protein
MQRAEQCFGVPRRRSGSDSSKLGLIKGMPAANEPRQTSVQAIHHAAPQRIQGISGGTRGSRALEQCIVA